MTDDAVNTARNSKVPGRPFVKGDPRINRKGRPLRSLSALEKEWQDIWSEVMFDDKGLPIIDEVTGKALTRLRARMRIATSSRNTQEFRTALEYAYGKPKTPPVQVTGADGGKLIIEIVKASEDTNKDE